MSPDIKSQIISAFNDAKQEADKVSTAGSSLTTLNPKDRALEYKNLQGRVKSYLNDLEKVDVEPKFKEEAPFRLNVRGNKNIDLETQLALIDMEAQAHVLRVTRGKAMLQLGQDLRTKLGNPATQEGVNAAVEELKTFKNDSTVSGKLGSYLELRDDVAGLSERVWQAKSKNEKIVLMKELLDKRGKLLEMVKVPDDVNLLRAILANDMLEEMKEPADVSSFTDYLAVCEKKANLSMKKIELRMKELELRKEDIILLGTKESDNSGTGNSPPEGKKVGGDSSKYKPEGSFDKLGCKVKPWKYLWVFKKDGGVTIDEIAPNSPIASAYSKTGKGNKIYPGYVITDMIVNGTKYSLKDHDKGKSSCDRYQEILRGLRPPGQIELVCRSHGFSGVHFVVNY